jgi:hypothetical protein
LFITHLTPFAQPHSLSFIHKLVKRAPNVFQEMLPKRFRRNAFAEEMVPKKRFRTDVAEEILPKRALPQSCARRDISNEAFPKTRCRRKHCLRDTEEESFPQRRCRSYLAMNRIKNKEEQAKETKKLGDKAKTKKR